MKLQLENRPSGQVKLGRNRRGKKVSLFFSHLLTLGLWVPVLRLQVEVVEEGGRGERGGKKGRKVPARI